MIRTHDSKLLVITCEKQRCSVTKDVSEVVDELNTSQEEADTRLLLHTKRASSNNRSNVIVTKDTYMFNISLNKWQYVYPMWNKKRTLSY